MTEKPIIAAGLDIGSAWVRCTVSVIENSTVRLIGCGEAPSQGWLKGRIADPGAVAESVLHAVRAAEQTAQTVVESAVVGVGGPTVRGANSRAPIDLGRPREIDQYDVSRATKHASKVLLHEDQMVLQICLQDFVVDDHPGHRDPRGMVASRLEANVHVITLSTQEHNTLVTAVNQAHLEVEETVFEPMAASYAAVKPEERREGIALVDLGVHSTDLVVYYGDALQLAASLPLCGDHFTRDVARGLTTTYEDAVRLKEEYGSAVVGGSDDTSLIEVPSHEHREPREAPRRKLNQILEARAEELFRYVRRELARVGMEEALMGGVVLTGGGAKMNDVLDMAEKVLNCQARNGLTVGVRDWPDYLQDPVWTAAAGLMMYSARLKERQETERRAQSFLGRLFR